MSILAKTTSVVHHLPEFRPYVRLRRAAALALLSGALALPAFAQTVPEPPPVKQPFSLSYCGDSQDGTTVQAAFSVLEICVPTATPPALPPQPGTVLPPEPGALPAAPCRTYVIPLDPEGTLPSWTKVLVPPAHPEASTTQEGGE